MRTRPSKPIRRPRRPGIFDDGMVPSLSLDFMSGTLDPRITFTRSTAGTYYSNGLVVTAQANIPRFQTHPVTGESEGLLIEAGITNLVCGSQTFATSGGANNWADTNISRDATLRTSPDGTANALRIAASDANATVLNNLALTSASRTFSLWMRRVTGTGNVELTMDGGTGWTAQAITASWTRFQMSATTTAHVGIRIVTSGDEIEIWGAQVEAQAFVSSYIPTTTTTVARGLDGAVMTGTNFSSWYNQSEGTIYASVYSPTTTPAAGYGLNDNTLNNRMNFGLASGTLASNFVVVTSTASQANLLVSGTPTIRNTAFAYRTNDFSAVVNGSAPATDLVGTVPAVTQLQIGGNTSFRWNSTIRQMAYWPIRLPNQTLQGITA